MPKTSSPPPILRLVNATLRGPDGQTMTESACTIAGATIASTGDASVGAGRRMRVVDVKQAVVTPGFVDAHVHLTMTGLTMDGLDLHAAGSASALRSRLARHTAARTGRFVWGYGWDDAAWPEPPTGNLIQRAAGDRFVYLSRVDGHSALVSHALFAAAGCEGLDGAEVAKSTGSPTGIVRRDAHHAVRDYFLSRIPPKQIRSAHRRAAGAAVAAGITTVHEMSGPLHAAGERDMDLLLEDSLPISVVCYYATDDVRVATTRGLRQIGGDYNVDGALGSRTAALCSPYADARGHRGFLYRDASDLAEFFSAASRAGLQAAVHCIGDAGCEAAVEGLERARRAAGGAVTRLRHRLEHFEMASPDLIRRAVAVGASFSMQPAFDATWGGPAGMYAARVGSRRAKPMNNLRAIIESRAPTGFGSDSPVTPLGPLAAIRAATHASNPAHSVSVAEAWFAHTAGAHSLARQEAQAGSIKAGQRADLIVWDGDPLRSSRARVRATISRGRVVYGGLSG